MRTFMNTEGSLIVHPNILPFSFVQSKGFFLTSSEGKMEKWPNSINIRGIH